MRKKGKESSVFAKSWKKNSKKKTNSDRSSGYHPFRGHSFPSGGLTSVITAFIHSRWKSYYWPLHSTVLSFILTKMLFDYFARIVTLFGVRTFCNKFCCRLFLLLHSKNKMFSRFVRPAISCPLVFLFLLISKYIAIFNTV